MANLAAFLGRDHRRLRRALAILLVSLCTVVPGRAESQSRPADAPAAAQTPPPAAPGRRVLLLYGEPRMTRAVVTLDTEFRARLQASSPVPVTFYTEYLDLNLFDGAAPLPELRELLRRKYESRPLDLIVAAGSRALRIAMHNRADIFSGAPVVFVAVDPTAASDLRLDADVTGTWLHLGWTETLDTARRLQPTVRRAVVVTGVSPADRVWMDSARKQLAEQLHPPVEVSYLAGLTVDDILARVSVLSEGAVVLAGSILRDSSGRDLAAVDVVRRIAAAAPVPVYGLFDTAVGVGAVGGHVVSFEAHGKIAADLALRVLAGERPAPSSAGTTVPTFDARQLARWRLDARRLPAQSTVLFQEPSLWARYRWYIAGAVGIVLVQSGLIAALLALLGQRRRAQAGLAERLRFETLLSELSGILAGSSAAVADRQLETALRRIGEVLGVDWVTVRLFPARAAELELTHTWTRPDLPPRPPVIREDETPWIFAQLRKGRVVRLEGHEDLPAHASADRRSVEALGVRSMVLLPLVRADGAIGCLSIGTVLAPRQWPDEWVPRLRLLADAYTNALERQRSARATQESQAAIRDLAGRLMTAQEEERRRIARDLHDDVNQELAAQSIALSTLDGRLPGATAPEVREEISRLHRRTVDLAEAIRRLSHSLHPGVLQHAGLVAALRSYCRGFERDHGLRMTFHSAGKLDAVPSRVALCLYRVAQEGLGNAAQHAKAQQVAVSLERHGDIVTMIVRDDGSGFDVADRRRDGLGLISLDERVRLAGGHLTIDSSATQGTELRVVVPLAEGGDAARDRAAG